jgi:hypothetical protein
MSTSADISNTGRRGSFSDLHVLRVAGHDFAEQHVFQVTHGPVRSAKQLE